MDDEKVQKRQLNILTSMSQNLQTGKMTNESQLRPFPAPEGVN